MFSLLSRCKQPNGNKKENRNSNKTLASKVPHAIPEGMENAVCPVTGLSLEGHNVEILHEAAIALSAMEMDPDIIEEALALKSFEFIPLNVRNAAHQANAGTRRLVRSVGLPKLREFTEAFYAKVFRDPHLDQFIRRHDDPHGERFAL